MRRSIETQGLTFNALQANHLVSNEMLYPGVCSSGSNGRLSPDSVTGKKSFHRDADDVFGDTDSEGTVWTDRMKPTRSNIVCGPCDNMRYYNDEDFSNQRSISSQNSFCGVNNFASATNQSNGFGFHSNPSRNVSMSPSMPMVEPPKCRQLPCKTFISTGTCPYGDRCVFLHDPCIASKQSATKVKRKTAEDNTIDAFFWPTMTMQSVMSKVDSKKMPHVSQSYVVAAPHIFGSSGFNNDQAVFSMWEHFLDICQQDLRSAVAPRLYPANSYAINNCRNTTNTRTGKHRLPIFVALSEYHEEFAGYKKGSLVF